MGSDVKKHVEVEELWVPIEGYPNYEVSNYGRICNVKTNHELTIMFTKKNPDTVVLWRNGLKYRHYVKDLVAEAFFVNWSSGMEVRHINRYTPHDNSVLNLTLGTPA